MVVTDDRALADTMRSLGNQGRDSDGTWLRHVRLGYNYRLDELSAAVGVAQLERLEELRSGRRRVAAAYERALRGVDWVRMPRAGAEETVDWHVYVVRLHEEIDRDGLTGRLAQVGVPARPHFAPLHLQPFYRAKIGFRPGDFPVIERVAAASIAYPPPIPKGVVSTWWSAAGRSHTLTRRGPLGLLPACSATPTEWLV
jgi:perosamine synthetase